MVSSCVCHNWIQCKPEITNSDITYTGYNVFWRIFQLFRRVSLLRFRIFRVNENSFEAKTLLWIFSVLWDLFFFTLFQQLFYSLILFFSPVPFFRNFHMVKRPRPLSGIVDFEWRKVVVRAESFFYETFPKKFEFLKNGFFVFPVGQMWFQSLMHILWGIFGAEKVIKV